MHSRLGYLVSRILNTGCKFELTCDRLRIVDDFQRKSVESVASDNGEDDFRSKVPEPLASDSGEDDFRSKVPEPSVLPETNDKYDFQRKSVQSVDTQKFKLDRATLGLIIEEINYDTWLENLELHHVSFTVDDAKRLGLALRNNQKLTNLVINHCQLGDDHVCAMLSNMKKSSRLKTIDFQHNLIDERGYLALYHFIQAHPTLRQTRLMDNPVTSRGQIQIRTPIGLF